MSPEAERGLAFVAGEQKANGEFTIVRGRRVSRLERWGLVGVRKKPGYLEGGLEMRAIFVSALIARILARVAGAEQVVELARAHLLAERNNDGLWCFHGKDCDFMPPDVDDTAYALLALPAVEAGPTIDTILANSRPDGAVLTWFADASKPDFRIVIDPVVNANVLTLVCERSRQAPELARWVHNALYERAFRKGTQYYPSPVFFLYALAALKPALTAKATEQWEREIVSWLNRDGPLIDAALAAAAIRQWGPVRDASPEPALSRIRREQCDDGGWQAEPIFGGKGNWYGCRAISSALCLQAIGA